MTGAIFDPAIFDPVRCQGKTQLSGRALSARTLTVQDAGSQRCLSAVVPALAEPIIHSLPQAPKSRRTRLS